MSSPSQRRGSCGHMMAGFDFQTVCARCRDQKKGQDPCVEKPGSDCLHCNSLTPEQLAQLSTPSYKIKKERRVLQSSTPAKNPQASDAMLSPTLVDPALVEVEDGQSTSRLPGLSEQPVEKKKKKHEKKVTSSKSVKPEKSGKSTSRRPSSSDSTDQKLEVMEQKWLDRLEALLLAKSLDRPQEPVFSAVKVAPPHAPPANVVRTQPFLKPSDQPSHRPSSTLPATEPAGSAAASKAGSDTSQPSQPPETSGMTGQSVLQKHMSSTFDYTRRGDPSSTSDSDSVAFDRPVVDLYPEEGELSDEHDVSFTDPDQSLRRAVL